MLGFIYQWTDKKTGLKYIGRHEGNISDGYIGSGTKFIAEYNIRPSDFEREILWSTDSSIEDLVAKEAELLSKILDEELYYGSNRKYYNQVRNSSGYTSVNNPMKTPEVVERMLLTRKIKGTNKNPWQATVEKYGYDEACKIQSRRKLGNTHGSGNKGKPKSEEHKKKISSSSKSRNVRHKPTGRKPSIPYDEILNFVEKFGINGGAEQLGLTVQAFYHRVLRAKSKKK
jgi:hypothetical protein